MVGSSLKDVVEPEPTEEWFFAGKDEADLTSMDQTTMLFQKYRPTHVIHLASLVGGIYANRDRNLDFYRLNHLINDNVLWCCYTFNVKKVLSCLSTTIFTPGTSSTTGPVDESHEGYSWSKRMILVLNKMYNKLGGGLYTSFIPCNIYGPKDNFNPVECHFIPAIISRMDHAQEEVVIHGDGKPVRQFIYSKDLARIIIWMVRNYTDTEPMIVAPEEEYLISSVVDMVAKYLEFDKGVRYDNKAGGEQRRTVSNHKLLQHLPHVQFTPLEQGIKETIDWYMATRTI